MAIRKIARMGHPVLLRRADPVTDVAAPDLQRLIDDMIETLADADGVGLAAPQVFESIRLILACAVAEDGEVQRNLPVVLVNPVLAPIGEADEEGFEGCLSIPDIRGAVPRYHSVAYRALDRDGAEFAGIATGYFARILQHEVDHLDGILYPMRMNDLATLCFNSEMRHMLPPRGNES